MTGRVLHHVVKTGSPAARRPSSTFSRTKRALNVPPHPDFFKPSGDKDTIIFNPPAAEPSVYHTPFKFLPRTDPRRRAHLHSLFGSKTDATATSLPAQDAELAPMVSGQAQRLEHKYNVTEQDVAEMRRLRAKDPETFTVPVLARRFGCTRIFVMMCCQSSRDHQDKRRREAEKVRERWGSKKAAAMEDRKRRVKMLLDGEL